MKSDYISEIIRLASNASLVLPLVLYGLRVRYASREMHIIGILVILSALFDLAGYILFKRQESTVVLFNAYYAVLFILLSWFYYEILLVNSRRVLVWIGVGVYITSFIVISAFVQTVFQYQTLMWVITAIIMIIYSIAYFFHSLTSIASPGDSAYGLIWINIGVMIYFCLNLFLFVMGNYVLTKLDPETGALIWSSHNINNIIKNVLFAIGIFFYKKRFAEFG